MHVIIRYSPGEQLDIFSCISRA